MLQSGKLLIGLDGSSRLARGNAQSFICRRGFSFHVTPVS